MSSTDIIARGLITQTRTQLASSVEGEGSGKIGFIAAAPSGSGRTVQDKLRESTSVKDFGAIGDGIADDTAAIQAAINAVITPSGGGLYFPTGTYKITSKLVIPFSSGWRIFGQSRVGTRIRQYASNSRILSFETENTHSFTIEGFTFEYNTPQTTANTASAAIFFGTGATSTGEGMYNWQVRNCTFTYGFRAIAQDTSNSPPLWGFSVADCEHHATMAGAMIYSVPNPPIGQPNNNVRNCLLSCQGAGEQAIRLANCYNLKLENLEFLRGGPAQGVLLLETCKAIMIGCKSENFNAGAGLGNIAIFAFAGCRITAIGTYCTSVLGSAGINYLLRGSSGSVLSVIGLGTTTNMTGGIHVPYYADAMPIVADVVMNELGSGHASDSLRAILGPSAAVPKFNADKRQQDYITDIGDASVTLTATSDEIQYQNVTLTANRTITLPNVGLYEGMAFHVVRRATTPGAFTLQVVDPIGANNYTFASATNGYVKYRAKSGAWRIVEAGPV